MCDGGDGIRRRLTTGCRISFFVGYGGDNRSSSPAFVVRSSIIALSGLWVPAHVALAHCCLTTNDLLSITLAMADWDEEHFESPR